MAQNTINNNLNEGNEQTLTNIQNLQTEELKLYNKLNTTYLTTEQKEDIITKINAISQLRINLYTNLKNMYSTYSQNLSTSAKTIGEQVIAVDIIENELKEAKRRLQAVDEEMDNKLRLVEINTYYSKYYNARVRIMITIVMACIPILILSVLKNKSVIPSFIADILIIIILIFFCFILGVQLIDVFFRDNMNYDEFTWYFNTSTAPSPNNDTTATTTSTTTATTTSTTPACVGSACCYEGSTYDASQNICIPNSSYSSTTSTTTSSNEPTSTNITGNTVESMVGYNLTKQFKDKSIQHTNSKIKPYSIANYTYFN